MVCLVAGGAGDIGREACLRLGALGATVVAAGRPGQSMNNLREELNALACRHTLCEADLTLSSAWSAVVEETLFSHGRIDVLVNCAGALVPGNLETLEPETLRRIIDANFTSVVLGARAVIPAMRRQGGGHIVTVGSIGGMMPMPHEAIYSATKFAVRGFSLSLECELRGAGIAVSLISVGSVDTKMLVAEAGDDASTVSYILPPLSAGEVAQAIVRTIERPRIEIVLPLMAGKFSALLAAFPGFLSTLHPLLQLVGRRGLRRYRRSLAPAIAATEDRHGN